MTLRVLTVWQPWATLLVRGIKPPENRGWEPRGLKVGDTYAIHAGSKVDLDSWDAAHEMARAAGIAVPELDAWARAFLDPSMTERDVKRVTAELLPLSALVGTVVLDEVRRSARPGCVWFCGPVGWYHRDPVAFAEPVACAGAQGLWTAPETIRAAAAREYTRAREARAAASLAQGVPRG